jgi:superfamily I DNA/RNA helicase
VGLCARHSQAPDRQRTVKYFQIYEQALRDACAIDFADMIPLVVKAMTENESCRRSIASAYDHVLVDEYQDVNPGQVGLIDHFVNDGVRLWAVGEIEKSAASPPTSQQSISFAWQGLRFRCLAINIGKHH